MNWFKHISETNIRGTYNTVMYINIKVLEQKKNSLFGSSPGMNWCVTKGLLLFRLSESLSRVFMR